MATLISIRTLLDLAAYAASLLGVLPLYLYLDLPAKILFPVGLAAGIWCDRGQRYPFGRWPVTLLSAVPFAYYGLQLNFGNVVPSVVNVLVLMLTVRLVTEKAPRNYLQIFVLAIFSLAGSSLVTLSLLFFPALVLLIVSVTLGLVLLTFHSADRQMILPRRSVGPLLTVGLVLPVGSLLLMLVFFAILPRTRYPLWNFLYSGSTALSGFSENVRPGAFAGNAASHDLVFRVESEPLAEEDLYWRGIVLNVVDGHEWRRQEPPAGDGLLITGGRKVTQVVYPESRDDTYLIALDPTERIRGPRLRESADLVYRGRRSGKKPVSYQTVARVGGRLKTSWIDRDFYLRVPSSTSPRIREIAAELARGVDGAAAKVFRTEKFFLGQQLVYANSDLAGPVRPMEDFLFGKKRGYCEFFASSFALLLRLQGVPARLVGGYHGGTRNDLGGYYSITEDMAHVWVEALVDGSWRRIDPSRLAFNAASASFARSSRGLAWHRRLLDAADYFWTRAVISYDLNKQLGLLKGTAFKLRGLSVGGWIFPVVGWFLGAAACLATAFWVVRRLIEPVERRLERTFIRQLEKRFDIGPISNTIGLHTLAEETDDDRCREFAETLGRAIYCDRPLFPTERKRLRTLLKDLKRV
jgi:transglutaminase-like putative cysteine protease